ncbi:autophagy-related protein 16-2 isoform X2 [Vombatus ursinus]|uniref:autophagy-related protein 16-2 isoform X2 n=1 Tax=Vombatus ursinus TaxID=29139 RepID=UPI000FFD56AE|nr:autophagy-related protein 16-2 isoform X2 [Vombatus ursinus]
MPGPGALAPGSPPAASCRWKLHIIRQLQQRDRRQKALFLDLVEAYHRLLEKSDLLAHFTEKLPPEPPNELVHLPSRQEEEAGPMPEPTQSSEDLRRKWEEELAKIKLVCGEMAYQVVEKHMTLSSQDAMLEDQQGRLSALDARVRELEETRQWLAEQVDGQQDRIVEGKEAYDTLWAHTGHQEGALRQLEEEGRELVERLIQVKMQAAEDQNYRNERIERVKQARVSKELKKAMRRTVNISETLDPPSIAEPRADKQELLEVEAYEKQWKRPFRSASATSVTLARCMDVMKGLLDFRKRRGHSVSGAPEARYPSIPVCGVSCLPARAQDIQEAHRSEVNAVCFSSNSSLVATGGADRLIRLWNVVGGRLEADQMLEGAGGSVTSLEFEPSGCYLLAATYNKAAQLWKVGESQSKETLSGHTDKVTAAKFKLTRQQAVTGSRDRTVKEWDLNKASWSHDAYRLFLWRGRSPLSASAMIRCTSSAAPGMTPLRSLIFGSTTSARSSGLMASSVVQTGPKLCSGEYVPKSLLLPLEFSPLPKFSPPGILSHPFLKCLEPPVSTQFVSNLAALSSCWPHPIFSMAAGGGRGLGRRGGKEPESDQSKAGDGEKTDHRSASQIKPMPLLVLPMAVSTSGIWRAASWRPASMGPTAHLQDPESATGSRHTQLWIRRRRRRHEEGKSPGASVCSL